MLLIQLKKHLLVKVKQNQKNSKYNFNTLLKKFNTLLKKFNTFYKKLI